MIYLAASTGCESDPPNASGLPTTVSPDGGTTSSCAPDETVVREAPTSCGSLPGDYTPRVASSSTDQWPACVSDGNEYVPFSPNISSVARVAAFEEIARLLGFGTAKLPTPDDFLAARVVYTQEQGIESRVSRREDEHEPALAAACRDLAPEEQMENAARCVGPARIRPILNAAFQEGIAGQAPALNAARIEAALLWFFYISSYKEATTAASSAGDVDSSWAKYTGGEPRASGIGLSRYVRARSLEAHDRIWDALLAVRCWRDLDNPTGVASNLELRDRARAQLDRALLRGMALIMRQRVQQLPCGTAWEGVKILGFVLGREAASRDAVLAQALGTELAKADVTQVDKAALTAALDQLFPCP